MPSLARVRPSTRSLVRTYPRSLVHTRPALHPLSAAVAQGTVINSRCLSMPYGQEACSNCLALGGASYRVNSGSTFFWYTQPWFTLLDDSCMGKLAFFVGMKVTTSQ